MPPISPLRLLTFSGGLLATLSAFPGTATATSAFSSTATATEPLTKPPTTHPKQTAASCYATITLPTTYTRWSTPYISGSTTQPLRYDPHAWPPPNTTTNQADRRTFRLLVPPLSPHMHTQPG